MPNKRIDVAGGGAAQVIADAPAGRGGSWNGDGVILFSSRPNSGVSRVSAMGGPPSAVTSVTDDAEIIGDNWPSFLPDGRHFLVYRRSANLKKMGVYLASLDDSTISPVLANNSLAVYASGRLLFVRDGSLFAIPFDQKALRTYGEEAILGNHIGYFSGSFGYASFSVNSNGLLVYGPGVAITTSLDWFDHSGRLTGHLGKPDTYASPRIAPDQASAAVAIIGTTMAERDIWIMDLARGTVSRATFDSGADWFPTWSPDHGRLFFGSTRVQVTSVFDKIGVGPDRLFGGPTITKGFATYPNDASHDGRFLACTVSTEKAYDIGVISLEDPPKLTSFLATAFNEAQARFSPNDRWLAYSSDESGAFEVYVRPFPSANAQWKISTGGGTQPEWRHDGKELFYIASDGKLMAVPVSIDGATFEPGTPTPLFSVEVPEAMAPYPGHYAVTADGQRFLVNTVIDQPTRPARTVVLNWTAGLKK